VGWSGYEQAQLIAPASVRPPLVVALNETEPPAEVISTVAGTASMAGGWSPGCRGDL